MEYRTKKTGVDRATRVYCGAVIAAEQQLMTWSFSTFRPLSTPGRCYNNILALLSYM